MRSTPKAPPLRGRKPRPNKAAIRYGLALLGIAMVVLVPGLVLVRIGGVAHRDPTVPSARHSRPVATPRPPTPCTHRPRPDAPPHPPGRRPAQRARQAEARGAPFEPEVGAGRDEPRLVRGKRGRDCGRVDGAWIEEEPGAARHEYRVELASGIVRIALSFPLHHRPSSRIIP